MLDTIGKLHLNLVQYLLRPHMTSNIVANVQYAIEEGEEDSELYVRSFLDYLNGVIRSSEHVWYEYKDLVKIWTAYLVLEKMRLEERFDYELISDESLNQTKLPSLVAVSFLRHFMKTVVRKSSSHIKLKIEVDAVDTDTAEMKITIVGDPNVMKKGLENDHHEEDCLKWINQKLNLIQYQNNTKLKEFDPMSLSPSGNISFNSIRIPIK